MPRIIPPQRLPLRRRLAFAIYYSEAPRLIGWNPTRFCNWLMDSRLHPSGARYDAFGGARWMPDYDPRADW